MFMYVCLFLFQISFIFSDQFPQPIVPNFFSFQNQNTEIVNAIDLSKVKQTRNRPSGPPSLTLLMNFKEDGTTSFQIIQGQQIVYLDSGFCQSGQLFDPSTGYCRDIFCQELNHKFNGTTCIPDDDKEATVVHKRMSDIDLVLTLIISPNDHHVRGNYSKRLNTHMNKTCINDWSQMFHDTLQSYLDIDYQRIIKIKYILETDDDYRVNRSIFDLKERSTNKSDNALMTNSYVTIDKSIKNTLSKNESIDVNFYFTITDRNDTPPSNLTGLHVVTLLLLASEFHAVLDLCQNYSVKVESLAIVSDKNKAREEFCSDPDVMIPMKTGIIRRRVRPDGEIDYVVDIPELETTYESGDYTYLFIISTKTQPVTAQIDSTPSPSNVTVATKLVSVCNRQPRIVGRCPDSLVMRIGLCEVIQYKNFSIRIKRTNRLLTNREYRYDDLRPDLYIVVCTHESNNGTTQGNKFGFVEKAPGMLSTIATFLSIFALAITLITFALFSSLRNLPGCNTINLSIALMIGESLFISQSLILMTRSSVCLLFALGIHFFYLASFFWMNVMAFDLWETFHKGFALYVYEIRERLPLYSLYAWGMPVIIVLIGIILDATNAQSKPCYGRFFRGCYDVCFRTKVNTPLQGCWIESGLMRFLLFGCPVAIILIINFIFYALTVRSIRRGFRKVRVQVERKFQRKKQVVPGEHDVKIYMRMAVLAGFGWTLGFILFVLPDNEQGFKRFLVATVKYLFIVLNATPGLFIFGVYVCNRRVVSLYRQLFARIYRFFHINYTQFKEFLSHSIQNCLNKTKYSLKKLDKLRREDAQMDTLSISTLAKSNDTINQTTLTHSLTKPTGQLLEGNVTNEILNSSSSLGKESIETIESDL